MTVTSVLNMPASPWSQLPDEEAYAWSCALGSAIDGARHGRVTVLKDIANQAVAEIGPPRRAHLIDYLAMIARESAAGTNIARTSAYVVALGAAILDSRGVKYYMSDECMSVAGEYMNSHRDVMRDLARVQEIANLDEPDESLTYSDLTAVWHASLDYSALTDQEITTLAGMLTRGRDAIAHWAHEQNYGSRIPGTIQGIVGDSMWIAEEADRAIFWRAITRV